MTPFVIAARAGNGGKTRRWARLLLKIIQSNLQGASGCIRFTISARWRAGAGSTGLFCFARPTHGWYGNGDASRTTSLGFPSGRRGEDPDQRRWQFCGIVTGLVARSGIGVLSVTAYQGCLVSHHGCACLGIVRRMGHGQPGQRGVGFAGKKSEPGIGGTAWMFYPCRDVARGVSGAPVKAHVEPVSCWEG